MLSQSQLTGLQVSRGEVRRHLRVRRWAQRTSHVFSTTTGPLSWDQRLWLAVLHAGPTAMIGGLTAAKVHGLRNWERDDITVVLDDELSFEPIEGVQFFRSRRPLADMRARGDLPLCMVEPAILLFAGYEPNRRTAHGAVAAVVQQRLTDAERLRDWVERLRPLRRAKEFRCPARGHQWRGAVARRGRRQPCLHRVRGPATQPAASAPRLPREGSVHRLRVAPRRRAGVGAGGGWGFPHGVRPVHERHAPSAQDHHARIGWWSVARRTRSGTSPTR